MSYPALAELEMQLNVGRGVAIIVEGDSYIRTQRYTLENYLLESEHWAATLRNVYQRYPELAAQWGDVTYIHQQIEQGYRACIPLAAHNFVIRFVTVTYPQSTGSPLKYLEHYKAIKLDFATKLFTLGQQIGCAEDLGELYMQKVRELQSVSLIGWQEQICGKYVLDWLHTQLPNRPSRGQISLDDYLDRYMDTDPAPPPDLHQIITHILEDAKLT